MADFDTYRELQEAERRRQLGLPPTEGGGGRKKGCWFILAVPIFVLGMIMWCQGEFDRPRFDLPFWPNDTADSAPPEGNPQTEAEAPGGNASHATHVITMAVGDCFAIATAHDLDIVVPVACDAEHFGQILVKADLGAGPYETVEDWVKGGCAAAWPPAARQRLAAGEVREQNRTPSAQEWQVGDRTVVCSAVVADSGRLLTGSLV